jgi:hypothetical protein
VPVPSDEVEKPQGRVWPYVKVAADTAKPVAALVPLVGKTLVRGLNKVRAALPRLMAAGPGCGCVGGWVTGVRPRTCAHTAAAWPCGCHLCRRSPPPRPSPRLLWRPRWPATEGQHR